MHPLPTKQVNPKPSALDDAYTICEIKQHPFSVIIYIILAILGSIVSFGFIFILLPSTLPDLSDNSKSLIMALGIVAVAIIVSMLFVAVYIYTQTKLIVSNEHIEQIIQHGLFSRTTSRLSMANVEDVSAKQIGIFATIFNFGTLIVETAGEQQNFSFYYCPNPNHYAGEILNARATFIEQDMERAYQITHHKQVE